MKVELTEREVKWILIRVLTALHQCREGAKEGVEYSQEYIDLLQSLQKKLEDQSSSR